MEKNVLLTTRRGDEVIVIRPYTSIYNVKGLTEYINNIVSYVKENFVHKEEGKGLSTNDFTDENKAKLESLVNTTVTEIRVNGIVVNPENGVIDLTDTIVADANTVSDDEITDIFNQ